MNYEFSSLTKDINIKPVTCTMEQFLKHAENVKARNIRVTNSRRNKTDKFVKFNLNGIAISIFAEAQ